MKRIFSAIITALICLQMNAQDRMVWIDLGIQQNIGINNRFENKDLYKPFQKNNTTDLKIRASWGFREKWGIFGDLSLGLVSHNKGYEKINIFNEFDPDNYYISNSWYRDNSDYDVTGRLTFGLFYKFTSNKWGFIPYLGIGLDEAAIPSASYTIKEKDTNNMYNVEYIWIKKNAMHRMSGCLSLEFVSSYRLAHHTHLTLGVNYRYALSKPKFSAVVSDYYDDSIIDEINIKGKHFQTLGISLGVSFR